MTEKQMLYQHSSEIPSVEAFQQLRYLLGELGVPDTDVAKLHPGILSFIADHLGQINNLKNRVRDLQEKLQEAEFDIIRLRGQRNALRSTLMKNKS